MSLTRSREVFKASHWTSVSASVVEYLDYLLGTYRKMSKVEVPTGAITALQMLFSSALPAARDEQMQNPEASINDFLIVRETMREGGARSLERGDVGRVIEEHCALLDLLTKPHEMKDLSREQVVKTRIFLRNLQNRGEIEGHARYMRQAHPYNHPNDPPDDE